MDGGSKVTLKLEDYQNYSEHDIIISNRSFNIKILIGYWVIRSMDDTTKYIYKCKALGDLLILDNKIIQKYDNNFLDVLTCIKGPACFLNGKFRCNVAEGSELWQTGKGVISEYYDKNVKI